MRRRLSSEPELRRGRPRVPRGVVDSLRLGKPQFLHPRSYFRRMSPAHRRRVLAGAVVISLGVALLANSFALTGASGATNHKHKGGWGSTTTTAAPTKPKRGPTTTPPTTAAPTTTTSTSTTTNTGVPTPSSTSTSTTTTTTHPTGSYWVPPIGNLEWDWEIGHPLCNGNENQTAAQTAAIIAA